MERTGQFLLLHTGKGAHSYKQEFPNNRFVNMVITVCSSTAGGSPWAEQAGPRNGRRGRAKTQESSLNKEVRQGKRPSSPEKGGQDGADVVRCICLSILSALCVCDSCTTFISTAARPPLSALKLIKQ